MPGGVGGQRREPLPTRLARGNAPGLRKERTIASLEMQNKIKKDFREAESGRPGK